MRPMSLAERWPGEGTVSLAELLRGERPAVQGRTERRLDDYSDEILRSGFPGLRRLSGRALRIQLDSYLQRVVDRDFPELGHTPRNLDKVIITTGSQAYRRQDGVAVVPAALLGP